jgi:hypothetical protein
MATERQQTMRDFVNQDGAEGHNTNGQDTCEHCGYTGQDVERTVQYVGGRGDVVMALCCNRQACWRRWDAARKYALDILHGMPETTSGQLNQYLIAFDEGWEAANDAREAGKEAG